MEYAVRTWAASSAVSISAAGHDVHQLLQECPKRWSLYPPMILLPSGSFQTKHWASLLSTISSEERSRLWQVILTSVSLQCGQSLTHLAVNAGIPLTQDTSSEQENILRSPSGLIMLQGDFGPALPLTHSPTASDFKEAMWVSTKQNGIYQTWAPRYTMFSRGNVKEKARILDFHHSSAMSSNERNREMDFARSAAVDLYAGIGYFVFSYCAMAMSRVWAWEINPWSVEGLRRGAELNNWKIRVIKGPQLFIPTSDLHLQPDERIVVLEETNERALQRLKELHSPEDLSHPPLPEIRHVNCGFLPTSEPSWPSALEILYPGKEGWLHLHENVALDDIATRRLEIEQLLTSWLLSSEQINRRAVVEHVEQVKTFAPGVWHCVFDVSISLV